MVDMPAFVAYTEYMQYTLRNIPEVLDAALRQLAKAKNKSLNEVAVEALARAMGFSDKPMRYRKLSDLAGSWKDDPEFDAAIEEQHRIDETLWQ